VSTECRVCKKIMMDADSCSKGLKVLISTKFLNPIPYGKETKKGLRLQLGDAEAEKFLKMYPNKERCPDCNVKTGGIHHPGCDQEECPRCHFQIISCDCKVE